VQFLALFGLLRGGGGKYFKKMRLESNKREEDKNVREKSLKFEAFCVRAYVRKRTHKVTMHKLKIVPRFIIVPYVTTSALCEPTKKESDRDVNEEKHRTTQVKIGHKNTQRRKL
jgi:hypothetical protein